MYPYPFFIFTVELGSVDDTKLANTDSTCCLFIYTYQHNLFLVQTENLAENVGKVFDKVNSYWSLQ